MNFLTELYDFCTIHILNHFIYYVFNFLILFLAYIFRTIFSIWNLIWLLIIIFIFRVCLWFRTVSINIWRLVTGQIWNNIHGSKLILKWSDFRVFGLNLIFIWLTQSLKNRCIWIIYYHTLFFFFYDLLILHLEIRSLLNCIIVNCLWVYNVMFVLFHWFCFLFLLFRINDGTHVINEDSLSGWWRFWVDSLFISVENQAKFI